MTSRPASTTKTAALIPAPNTTAKTPLIPPLISRELFPFFVKNPNLVYLDNAATAQLPAPVIETLNRYYSELNSNPPRGLYKTSVLAETAVAKAREKVRDFLAAKSADEIIFTKSTTDSLNLLAHALDEKVSSADEIIVSLAEHHSNLLPWLELSRRTGAKLTLLDCFADPKNLDYHRFEKALSPRTKIIALSGMSNVTGNILDFSRITKIIANSPATTKTATASPSPATTSYVRHSASRPLLILDAAQLAAHDPELLKAIDYDAMAFSGHKLGSPTGIGVLHLKNPTLKNLRPPYTGGEMVRSVHLTETTHSTSAANHPNPHLPTASHSNSHLPTNRHLAVDYLDAPSRFEAGTSNVGGIIALGATLDFLKANLNPAAVKSYEEKLMDYLLARAKNIPHLNIHFAGNGIFTFTLDDIHPHDIAQLLDEDGICIRAGYHCAQPLHELLGLPPTARASLTYYTTTTDLDHFLASLKTVRKRLGYDQ